MRLNEQDKLPTQAGIYEIICRPTGQHYLTYSRCIRDGAAKHCKRLARGKHDDKRLLAAYWAHRRENFEIQVLMVCAPEDLKREAHKYMLINRLARWGMQQNPYKGPLPCHRTLDL